MQIYGLQGIAGFSSPEELHELAYYGIQPGESRALGGIANLGWRLDPKLQLNLRAAGQVAFNELTNDMGFSLGSDVGLRLPGSIVSGDTGWLSDRRAELDVLAKANQCPATGAVFGVGGVETTRAGVTYEDTIGAAGVLVRWLHGNTGRWNWVEISSTRQQCRHLG